MPPRVLPPYKTLRSLVEDKGLSYAAIAKQYGVGYDSVYQMLKAETERAGDEWPIKRDLSRAVRQGIEEATIDATWVRESLLEAYEEAQEDFLPDTLYVNVRQATLARTERGRRVRYHRDGCVYIRQTDVKISRDAAQANPQLVPCGTCCRKLSIRQWSQTVGIEQSHLSMVMNKKITRVRKTTAVKMMQAVGDQPHATLANWQPNWERRKWKRAETAR